MQGGVEHDDREGEDVAGVRLLEDVGVLLAEAAGEGVHHAVYLHRLARQSATEIEVNEKSAFGTALVLEKALDLKEEFLCREEKGVGAQIGRDPI